MTSMECGAVLEIGYEGEFQSVREYTTDSGPADYFLFIDRHPVGGTETKKEINGELVA